MVFILPLVRRSGSSSKWSILLVGPCNSGKTSLFLTLKNGKLGQGTVTSMQPNEGFVKISQGDGQAPREVHVIDLPGHPRLESFFFKHVNAAKGVIFMIDSIEFMPNKEEIARQVYRLLSSPVIRGRGIPILMACNKADGGAKAHTVDFIRKRLEKDIQEIHASNYNLESIGSEKEQEHNFLFEGDSFKFSDLAVKRKFHRPLTVTFAKISVLDGDLEAVKDFCLNTCKY